MDVHARRASIFEGVGWGIIVVDVSVDDMPQRVRIPKPEGQPSMRGLGIVVDVVGDDCPGGYGCPCQKGMQLGGEGGGVILVDVSLDDMPQRVWMSMPEG